MRQLELYPGKKPAQSPLETTEALDVNPACTLCELHKGPVRVCIPPEGTPGGVLIVGEGPGAEENRHGRPFIGASGALMRKVLRETWTGPYAIANATNCYPAGTKVTGDHVAACRPYLAATLAEVRPTRIVCLGGWAVEAVLGQNVPVMSARRGYGFLSDGTPVFVVAHPAAALRNKFIQKFFNEDFKWALTAEVEPPPFDAFVNLIDTAEEAEYAFNEIGNQPAAVDVETAGNLFSPTFRLLCVGIALPDGRSWVFDEKVLVGPAGRVLADWLSGAGPKIGQNWKYDYLALKCAGFESDGWVLDTRLARKLLDPDAKAGLATMAYVVGMGGHKDEAKTQATKRKTHLKGNLTRGCKLPEWTPPEVLAALALGSDIDSQMFALIDKDILYRYNALDCVSTAKLFHLLLANLVGEPDLKRTADTLLHPATMAIARMEANGIAADRQRVIAVQKHCKTKLEECEARFTEVGVNPRAPGQLSKYFYETLKLPILKMTEGGKTGAPKGSVDAKVLRELDKRTAHPMVKALIQHRHFTKLLGVAEGLERFIRPDGRIHPRLLPDGTRTGRLSSQDPNCQNLRRPKDEEGVMIRDCFVARPGYVLLELDLSQIELRIAAMLSGDPEMIRIFKDGVDYHQRTAELIAKAVWNITPDRITPEHRTIAKTTNFASAYGAGAERIADELGCSVAEAEKIQAAIMGAFSKYTAWTYEQIKFAQREGYVWSYFPVGTRARRRPLLNIVDREDSLKASTARHAAGNTPVQGTANDYCLASLVAVDRWILEEGLEQDVLPVLTVHDSLLFEVREDLVYEVAKKVLGIMTGWPTTHGVPLVADAKVGQSWGSMKELEMAA